MKVLVISHNCANSLNNMGLSIKSIIKNLPNSEICQLYIKPSLPDEKICTSWFLVSDKMVLKNIFLRQNIGKEIHNPRYSTNIANKSKKIAKKIQFKESFLLFRDLVWKLGKWKTSNLNNWLSKEKPEIIILFPGQSLFVFEIADWISKQCEIPIIYFFTDDYYFYVPRHNSFFYRIQHRRIKNKMNQLFTKSSNIITITDLMKKDYKNLFYKSNIISYLSVPTLVKEKKVEEIYDLVYLGNLGLGRWKSLLEIGKILDDINPKYKLDIYSSTIDNNILKNFKNIKSVRIHKKVDSQEVSRIISKSKIALHVEDISGEYTERVKYTFSTKIADILNSDTCLMMLAPKNIASTEYCQKNQCAFVVTDKNQLKSTIIELIDNWTLREQYVSKAHEVVNKYHNVEKNGKKLYYYINEVIRGGSL